MIQEKIIKKEIEKKILNIKWFSYCFYMGIFLILDNYISNTVNFGIASIPILYMIIFSIDMIIQYFISYTIHEEKNKFIFLNPIHYFKNRFKIIFKATNKYFILFIISSLLISIFCIYNNYVENFEFYESNNNSVRFYTLGLACMIFIIVNELSMKIKTDSITEEFKFLYVLERWTKMTNNYKTVYKIKDSLLIDTCYEIILHKKVKNLLITSLLLALSLLLFRDFKEVGYIIFFIGIYQISQKNTSKNIIEYICFKNHIMENKKNQL